MREGREERGEVGREERDRGRGQGCLAAFQEEGEDVRGVATEREEEKVERLSGWRIQWERNSRLCQGAAGTEKI